MIMANVDVDEKTLQAVANETGGQFYRATDTDSLQKIYEQINRYETSAQTRAEIRARGRALPVGAVPGAGLAGTRGALAAHEVSQVTVRFSDPNWLLGGTADVRCAHRVVASVRCAAAGGARAVRRAASAAQADRLGVAGPPLPAARPVAGRRCCVFARRSRVPELGYHWEKISRRGNEVVFAIDTSRSMLTPDVKPNRLTRAKLAIDDMAQAIGR